MCLLKIVDPPRFGLVHMLPGIPYDWVLCTELNHIQGMNYVVHHTLGGDLAKVEYPIPADANFTTWPSAWFNLTQVLILSP